MMKKDYEKYMDLALEEAKKAFNNNDVPVGCVILDENNNIISRGYNQKEKEQDVTLHAEIIAIKEASKLRKNRRLDKCTVVVTLSPCLMCLGAIISSRINKLVIGTYDDASDFDFRMFKDLVFENKIELIDGVKEKECSNMLKEFFKTKRF